jgi:hypothetical protein
MGAVIIIRDRRRANTKGTEAKEEVTEKLRFEEKPVAQPDIRKTHFDFS